MKEGGVVREEEDLPPGEVFYAYWNLHSQKFCSINFLEIQHMQRKPPTHLLS